MNPSQTSTFSITNTGAQSQDVPMPVLATVIEEQTQATMHAPLASQEVAPYDWANTMAPIPEDMAVAPPLPALSVAQYQEFDMMPPTHLPQLEATPSAIARAFSDSAYTVSSSGVAAATPMADAYAAEYLQLHPTATQEAAQLHGYSVSMQVSPEEADEELWNATRLIESDEEIGNVVGGDDPSNTYKWTTLRVRCFSFCNGTYCDTICVGEIDPPADVAVQGKQYMSVSYSPASQRNGKMRHSGDKYTPRSATLADGRRINTRELAHTITFTDQFKTGFVVNAAWKTRDHAVPLTLLGDASLPELPLILMVEGTYPDADGNVARARHVVPVSFRNIGCTAGNCIDMTHDLCQASKNHTSIANVKITRDPESGRFRAVIIREFLQGFADGTAALEQSIRDKGL